MIGDGHRAIIVCDRHPGLMLYEKWNKDGERNNCPMCSAIADNARLADALKKILAAYGDSTSAQRALKEIADIADAALKGGAK